MTPETPATRGASMIPFAFGFAAQATQVVLARDFLTVFYGNELSVALVFGLWLFWIAAGTLLGGRVRPTPLLAAAFAQLLLTAGAVWTIRDLRAWFDVPAGQYLPLWGLVLAAATILSAPCLLFGAQFAWTARLVGSSGRTYALEALGAALGAGVVAIGARTLGSFAIVAAGSACLFGAFVGEGRRVALAGLVASMALAAGSGSLDRWSRERYWRHLAADARLRETFEAADGPVAAVERGGEVSIFRGGRLWATLPERGENAPAACVILLQHPAPRRVLVAGGSARLLPEVLRHGVEEVDAIESDLALFALVRRYDPDAVNDRRVRLREGDPRRFLRGANPYDVVLVAAGEPDTALANRFYTREFFELARSRLASGGILAVGPVAAPSSYSADELLLRNAILHATLASVFRQVLVTPGSGAWLIASEAELTLDDSEIRSRAADRGREGVDVGGLTESFYVEKANSEFRTGRVFDPLGSVSAPAVLPGMNSDARPLGYFESLRAWAWQSGDAAGRWLTPAAGVPFWAVAALFALPALVRRRGVAVFYAGFAGMALSVGAILGFHASVGVLHESLGLLVGGFMLGGAAGALTRTPVWAALGAVAAVGAAMTALSHGIWLAALLPVAGAAVGAAYGALSDERSAARLYAIDVAGGCLAALVAVPLIVPLFGTGALATLAAIPCAVSALLFAKGT